MMSHISQVAFGSDSGDLERTGDRLGGVSCGPSSEEVNPDENNKGDEDGSIEGSYIGRRIERLM
jgi:hypothetical protein